MRVVAVFIVIIEIVDAGTAGIGAGSLVCSLRLRRVGLVSKKILVSNKFFFFFDRGDFGIYLHVGHKVARKGAHDVVSPELAGPP